ncbi:PTS sugar transporter subunit IIA [Cellulomonas soli]|uniref:PTS sugar transporter subunit IIA n=1 Tax=Cellulomonas soli TaxID=931535 RepID=UPI003F86CC94
MLLLSPVPGVVRAVADVPDPVFAQEIVGPGLAVEPNRIQTQDVLAPADGVVGALHPHAFALELGDGRTVLVHLGVDTVGLRGSGFTLHVEAGQAVRAGDRILTWSPVDVALAGLSTLCPVVALQADRALVHPLVEPGAVVAAGDALIDWRD